MTATAGPAAGNAGEPDPGAVYTLSDLAAVLSLLVERRRQPVA